MKPLLVLALLALTSCGTVTYDSLEPGEFKGSVLVMWVGESDTRKGDGKFVYVPSPGDPLMFTRPNGEVIVPDVMYTDGGSVPRAVQFFNGFSPWGYAPAYMVHDWIFVAKHCRTDGTPTEGEAALADMTFNETAEIAGEAIRALIETQRVAANDIAPSVITGVVGGPFSYARWTVKNACVEDRVTEDHLALVAAALAPAPVAAPTERIAGAPDAIVVAEPAAQIITEIRF